MATSSNPWEIQESILKIGRGGLLVSTGPIEGQQNSLRGNRFITYEEGCHFRVESTTCGLSVTDSALRYVSIPATEFFNLKAVPVSGFKGDTGNATVGEWIERKEPGQ